MRRTLPLAAAVLFLAAPVGAQDMGDHTPADQQGMATSQGVPDGWMMRFDRSNAGQDMVDFQVMEPGWHVKTGRAGAAIFWQSGTEASGAYTLATQMHLFEPATHAEAFGLFVGGSDLGGADQQYLYFLVRQTGEYLIKRRVGGETENVVGWTAHEAVPTMEAGAPDPTEYNLAVAVGSESVAFMVNGETVHSLPASEVETDGQAGIRINHMLNIHVQTVTVDSGM
jgi:hypothetical protein